MITCAAKQIAYKRARESWGGATINARTSEFVEQGTVGYVFTDGPTVRIPEDASWQRFKAAIESLEENFGEFMEYIGVFHDNAKRCIDLNTVKVVKTREEVDAAYAAGYLMPGGAFELHTGDGYWPQGRPEEYS